MCIAIPPPMERPRPGSALWRRIRTSPTNLFGLGALVQILALVPGALFFGPGVAKTALPLGAFGAAGSLWLGIALQQLPRRLGALPPGYPLYAGVLALLVLGGWIALAGLMLGHWTGAAVGQLLVTAAWWPALRALAWKLRWHPGRPAGGILVHYGSLWLAAALHLAVAVGLALAWKPAPVLLSLAGLGIVLGGWAASALAFTSRQRHA